MTRPLTPKELLILQNLCLDAGNRSKERSAVAWATGNLETAEYEVRLQDQYARLRIRFADEMMELRRAEQDQATEPKKRLFRVQAG